MTDWIEREKREKEDVRGEGDRETHTQHYYYYDYEHHHCYYYYYYDDDDDNYYSYYLSALGNIYNTWEMLLQTRCLKIPAI